MLVGQRRKRNRSGEFAAPDGGKRNSVLLCLPDPLDRRVARVDRGEIHRLIVKPPAGDGLDHGKRFNGGTKVVLKRFGQVDRDAIESTGRAYRTDLVCEYTLSMNERKQR
jgi:hypothetical protein